MSDAETLLKHVRLLRRQASFLRQAGSEYAEQYERDAGIFEALAARLPELERDAATVRRLKFIGNAEQMPGGTGFVLVVASVHDVPVRTPIYAMQEQPK